MIVGSSLEDKGGIVTVMTNILNSSLKKRYNFEVLETYITGSVLERLGIYIIGLWKFIYKLIFRKPDIIHIHMSYKGSFYRKSILLLIAKIFRVPTIIHVHGSSFKDFYGSLNKLQRKYCHFVLNNCDKLIVLSNEWFKFFSNFVSTNKISVLYNGVDAINYPVKREHVVPVCLFMGRLGKRKGVYDLLESVRILKEKEIKAKFLLAGDGEIENVKQVLKGMDIEEYVDVLGWIDSNQKDELIKKSNILVLPSYNEGLPMAILEGMSYGLPIVSTPVGGIPEVIEHGKNGFLIEPGDVNSLANYLQQLINDANMRCDMGLKNQEIIKNKFSLTILMEELSNIYVELLNEVK